MASSRRKKTDARRALLLATFSGGLYEFGVFGSIAIPVVVPEFARNRPLALIGCFVKIALFA